LHHLQLVVSFALSLADCVQLRGELVDGTLKTLDVGGLGGALPWNSLKAASQGVVLVHGGLELRADLIEDVVELGTQLDQPIEDLG
jgi:hypothetical protein